MDAQIIGENLLARDENGRLRTRIATVFPRTGTIVTLPGIHATQRCAYVDHLNTQRQAAGLIALADDEEEEEWDNAVDLVIEDELVLIRPDPNKMDLAFEADEALQRLVPKKQIKFLHVLDARVRDAIRRRGELWRICPLPRSCDEMKQKIAASKIGIGCREIYFYNPSSGTRYLTCQRLREFSQMSESERRRHLAEVSEYAARRNRTGEPEVAFFMSQDAGLPGAFAAVQVESLGKAELESVFEALYHRFHDAVGPEFRRDDMECPDWRSHMYAAIIGQTDKAISEEALLGLSAEFFMQVEWLPGGRIEDGELIFDSVFEEEAEDRNLPPLQRVCDDKARGFIFNFVRDYGEVEYVNVGCVVGSLSQRTPGHGRRAVYLAEVKLRGRELPVLRIIRMAKWGVREHLDEGKDLLSAVLESEDYTDYVLNRRLGCRQLGMNVSPKLAAGKVSERYLGSNSRHYYTWVWSTYFEREYIPGLATDKIPSGRFTDERFALGLARLLGRAAAPNLIVGRCDLGGNVIFDDGDELVIEDGNGTPINIIIADHTGTFVDYQRDLRDLAPAYAASINDRIALLSDPQAFADVFLQAFELRFMQIQQEYRKRRRAFETLFKHERRDEGGSFAYRWERVLARLQMAEARELAERIRRNIHPLCNAAATAEPAAAGAH